jgi:hypothetical protein
MSLHVNTRAFLTFLQKHPEVRARIAAPRDATLLYAGEFFLKIWQELVDLKRSTHALANKRTLPDVLADVKLSGQPHLNLLDWVKDLERTVPVEEQSIAWRALSGIFAANASGAVSFYIGSRVSRDEKKVFAITELPVLLRNPNVDPLTRDVLGYYQRCVRSGHGSVNFGFVRES